MDAVRNLMPDLLAKENAGNSFLSWYVFLAGELPIVEQEYFLNQMIRHSDLSDFQVRAGKLLLANGYTALARGVFNEILKKDPENPEALSVRHHCELGK